MAVGAETGVFANAVFVYYAKGSEGLEDRVVVGGEGEGVEGVAEGGEWRGSV